MFHREKTPGRQKVAALSGVIALISAAILVYTDRPASPPVDNLTDVLLVGRIDANDSSSCSLSSDGALVVQIKPGSVERVKCCVLQEPARSVRAGDKVSLSVIAEKMEPDVSIWLDTSDKRQIIMRQGNLYAAENIIKLMFGRDQHLGGKDMVSVTRFCVAATAFGGDTRTIKVVSKSLASSSVAK